MCGVRSSQEEAQVDRTPREVGGSGPRRLCDSLITLSFTNGSSASSRSRTRLLANPGEGHARLRAAARGPATAWTEVGVVMEGEPVGFGKLFAQESQATIRAWVGQRRIGYVKLGRSVRIPGAEIRRKLESGYVPPSRERRS